MWWVHVSFVSYVHPHILNTEIRGTIFRKFLIKSLLFIIRTHYLVPEFFDYSSSLRPARTQGLN